jgi:hypothetical protein
MNKQRIYLPTESPAGRRAMNMVKGFCAVCMALVLLLVPGQGLAFDFSNPFKDAAKAIQQHIDDLTKKHVDQGEKKVEETIDQTLGQQSNSPSQGAAPVQQETAGQSSAGQAVATAAVGGSLQAKVTEVPLGKYTSNPADGQMIISEDGGHVAIAMKKGSRQVMVVDGVEGPVFDEVIPFYQQFQLGGGHFAYLGRRGTEIIGVVDGHEVGRIVPDNPNLSLGLKTGPLKVFHFSSDGSRLVYPVFTGASDQPRGGFYAGASDPSWGPVYMVVDGKRSPAYVAIDLNQVLFAGNRLAYAAQTADQKWHAVIDGEPGPAYETINALQWNGDGTHYTFIGRHDRQNSVVVVDGKEGKKYPDNSSGMGIDALSLTANGHMAYRAQSLGGGHSLLLGNILVLDQKEITREAINFRFEHTALLSQPRLGMGMLKAWWFALSPDGQRIAYVKKTPGGQAAVIDGKSGFEYDKIFDLQFSPNSRRVAYIGQKGLFNFVVVDGEESPAYGYGRDGVREFRFSADGRHYAFEAVRPNTGDYFVVDDGQAGPLLSSQKLVLVEKSLLFSENGAHYAYAGNQFIPGQNQKWALIVDGEMTVKPGRVERFQKRDVSGVNTAFPVLAISPDGSRLAYTMFPPEERNGRQHLIVGSQAYPPYNSYSFPVFSPNGRHFAVAAWSHKANKQVILVDGKEGPGYDKILWGNDGVVVPGNVQTPRGNDLVFRFLDDQTLRVLAVRDGSIYRVTIDVGG